jgi:radical SAM protein with 4Fe4S-binding SPASM domain
MIGDRWIEVTTRIGCENLCKYCPQDVLESVYRGKRYITISDFQKVLDNVNKETTYIHFSGFSEPFLNTGSEYMMALAGRMGYNVVLFTTLRGFTKEKAEILKNNGAKFTEVRFHDYDGIGNDRLEFERKIELFKSINCSELYMETRIENPISRGGNLWDIDKIYTEVTCQRFECNVMLPNGDLVLCCSDWGLKHIIGNIYERHYDDPIHSKERSKLRTIAATYDSNILCKTCELAIRI